MSTIETDVVSVETFGYKQELKRSLSLFDLLVYGLIFISPTAPIVVFGIVYNAAKGMVPLVYVIGLVAMAFTALSYMAMSRAFPVAGSVYAYAGRSIGAFAGFIAGWAMLLDYLLLPTLTFVVCAIAMNTMIPGIPGWAWVVGLLTLATIVNYLGIEVTARINAVLLLLQLLVLAAFVGAGVWAIMHHVGGTSFTIAPFYNPAALTPSLIFGALSLAVLSFLGFDAISTMSEESRHGAGAIGRATILSLCLSAALFVAQTYIAALFGLGKTAFAPGPETDAAFYNISAMIGGTTLKFIVAVPGILFGAMAGSLVAQASTARLLFSMARDGKLPRFLAHVHPDRKVPENAIFVVAAITLVLGTALVDKLELLTSMVSFGALLGFLLLHASVVMHFMVRGKSRGWLRYLIAPLIGFVIIAYVLWNAEANAKIAGLAWTAVGCAIYLAFGFLRKEPQAGSLPL
jgi:amino acid transporter